MPTIELNGSSFDPGWVMATMLFPNESELREQLFTIQCAEIEIAHLPDDGKIEVEARTIELLIHAPSKRELHRQVAEATKRAIYAGDILASIYLMETFKGQCTAFAWPSMGKALFVAKQYSVGQKFGDGEQMYYSDKKIRDCWEEFKSVAHLWAAFRMDAAYPISEGSGAPDLFSSQESL